MRVAFLVLFARLSVGAVVYVDADAGGLDTGSSWTDGYTDLQSALGSAVSGDEIWVAEGTYRPTSGTDRTISFTLVEGVALYGGFAGTPGTEGDFGARDWGTYVTILSGDIGAAGDGTDNSYHVVVGASNATLDGFTVTGANGDGVTFQEASGGGMYNVGVTGLTVANCAFSGNSAFAGGGGMLIHDCSPAVVNCTFSDNWVRFAGAGIRNYGASSPVITGCTFSGNTADNYGGGMWNDDDSSVSVTGCTFSGNLGYRGGAIYEHGSAVITDCRFSKNAAEFGGGMYCHVGAAPALTNCVFSSNTADVQGGGAYTELNCLHTLTNCTFSGNRGSSRGGAMYNEDSLASITNCIFWGNWARSGPEIYGGGSVSYSDVQGGRLGTGNIDADPLFVDADGADDIMGTLDDDLRLQAGSPCIDAADADAAPASDIDGNVRWDDSGTNDTGAGVTTYVDVGAYEFQGTTPAEWCVVSEPHPGAAWKVGTGQIIRWATSAGVTDVKIELSRDGGAGWDPIEASTPNDGSHTWTVTDGAQSLPQTNCVIRISDAGGGGATGTSGAFLIFSGVWCVDADAPGPTRDGLSWASAFLHPQDAADRASAGHEVRVAEGTYYPQRTDTSLLRMKKGVALYGGYAGYGEAVPDERNRVAHPTTLDGNGEVYHVVYGAADGRLDGFAVTGGYAWGGASTRRYGGGLCNYDFVTGLTVANCVFSGNVADYGGGMCSYGACSPTLSNCSFYGNTADYSGGAIYSTYNSSPTIINCTFAGNTAADFGGGFCNGTAVTVSISNSILWDNSATTGSEIYTGATSSCTVTYSNVAQAGGFNDGGGNISVDPLLVDAAGGDLHLEPGSPCIDAADGNVDPDTDIDGNSRRDDPGMDDVGVGSPTYVDIGAFEFQGSSTPVIAIAAPASGAQWAAGAAQTITWTTTGGRVLNVRVEFARDGVTWEYIDGGAPVANAGTLDWTPAGPASADCLVRVKDAVDSSPAGLSDFIITEPLTVTIGASGATEGDGTLFGVGTVSVPTSVGSDLTVTFASDDTTEATVPTDVIIPAGQTSVAFDVTVVDDTEIDGDQTANISANATAYVSGGDSIVVQDNETRAMTVTLPASATEGDGTLTGAGAVSIPGTFATDLVISLASDDASELQVPGTVTITAGQTFSTFDLTVVDDGLADGARPVTVTASLSGWGDGVASLTVLDDEVGTFVVTLPASSTEGEAGLTGTVEIPMALAGDLTVTLESDDETELTVQATVDIVAGQTLASFPLTVADDAEIDGLQQATVTASAAGWNPGSDTMDVLDNETQTLTLTLPESANEGDGTLVGAGTVSIPGTWSTDLVIDFGSNDTTELTIVAAATILQGNTSASFDIVVVDDGDRDGTQTVTITASAAGWTSASAQMDITDDDSPPGGDGCAGGAPGAGLAFCIFIPYLALRRRRQV